MHPLDVRCMPHVLQAFQRDAGVTGRTAKEYARHVKQIFMQDGVAIEGMVSEEYLAIVKRLRPKDRHRLTSLRSFSTWLRRHGLTAAAYESLPEIAPENWNALLTQHGTDSKYNMTNIK